MATAPYPPSPQTPKARSGTPFTILGLVLAVLGFGTVMLFSSLTGGKSTAPSGGAQGSVVVAARDIPIRTPITAADLRVVRFAASDVPPAAFAKTDEIKEMVAAVEIKKGQPLTSNLLVKSGDAVVGPQSAYLPIPSGWVAFTIPTSEQAGVGGYIQAGDYISIVANVAGKSGQNVRTLYTNVHVLRIGPALTTDSSAPGQNQGMAPPKTGGLTSSLTVVVTQCQAEYLNWFMVNGTLKYTLESYKDYKPQDASADSRCPSVDAAHGVTHDDVASRWPGIFN